MSKEYDIEGGSRGGGGYRYHRLTNGGLDPQDIEAGQIEGIAEEGRGSFDSKDKRWSSDIGSPRVEEEPSDEQILGSRRRRFRKAAFVVLLLELGGAAFVLAVFFGGRGIIPTSHRATVWVHSLVFPRIVLVLYMIGDRKFDPRTISGRNTFGRIMASFSWSRPHALWVILKWIHLFIAITAAIVTTIRNLIGGCGPCWILIGVDAYFIADWYIGISHLYYRGALPPPPTEEVPAKRSRKDPTRRLGSQGRHSGDRARGGGGPKGGSRNSRKDRPGGGSRKERRIKLGGPRSGRSSSKRGRRSSSSRKGKKKKSFAAAALKDLFSST